MTTKTTGKDKALAQMTEAYEQAAPMALIETPSASPQLEVHPAAVNTAQAFKDTWTGLQAVWQFEKENQFGLSVLKFVGDIFVQVVLPLLSLIWLALSTAYRTARKPETKAAVIARYQSAKAWMAPKFGYERNAEQLTLPTD
jgi:hypothetical protein